MPEMPTLLDDLQFVSLAKEYTFAKKRAGETDLLFQFKHSLSVHFPSQKIPRKIVIVGYGISACEQAQALSHLGAEVTLIVKADSILPGFEPLLSNHVERVFHAQGIQIMKHSKPLSFDGPFLLVQEERGSVRVHKIQAEQVVEAHERTRVDELRLMNLIPPIGSFGPHFSEAVRKEGHRSLLRVEVAQEGLGRMLLLLSRNQQNIIAAHAIGKGIEVLLPYLLLAKQAGVTWKQLQKIVPRRSVISEWIRVLDDEIVQMQSAT